jgi:glucose-6-phosphate 1-dehydrogenase
MINGRYRMSNELNSDRCFHFKRLDPSVIVIFGASGDLAKRKLIPSLYRLSKDCSYSDKITIVGFARSKMEKEDYIKELKSFFDYGEGSDEFLSRIHYFQGNYDDLDSFSSLKETLCNIDSASDSPGNRLHYLSVPPTMVSPIVSNLKQSGNLFENKKSAPWSRVVIEKPFGYNLQTATELNEFLLSHMSEEQIYRIDHYLGKETVQNILMCRFANTFLEPLFNNKYVESVEITVSEELGVENRGGYFEKVGILRDMIQNHLFQLLALVSMEYPASFSAKSIHDEKAKLFTSIRKYTKSTAKYYVCRGQYTEGNDQVGYRGEKGVSPDSKTETFAAVKLFIDNFRWAGVPFLLRSGKRLKKKKSEIIVTFKQLPMALFENTNISNISNNHLHFRIQPQEGISLCMNSKTPGYDMTLANVDMNFSYNKSFEQYVPDAYERLLFDALSADMTLFNRKDEIEESWRFFDPIIKAFESDDVELEFYSALGDPPKSEDMLIEKDVSKWSKI